MLKFLLVRERDFCQLILCYVTFELNYSTPISGPYFKLNILGKRKTIKSSGEGFYVSKFSFLKKKLKYMAH